MFKNYLNRLALYSRSKLARNSGHVFVNHRKTEQNTESAPFEFTEESYKEIEKALKKFPSNYKKSGIISLLFIAQKQNDNFLPLSAMNKVAQVLEVPEMEVYEVAAFYTMFNREKIGKYHLQFCGTTPCMLRGHREVQQAALDYLGVGLGETTPDGLFTCVEVIFFIKRLNV